LRLGLRWNGIDLRSVEEIDALLGGVIELGMTFGLRILLAEGHGSEAKRADLDARATELAILHASSHFRGSARDVYLQLR
jgi:hypothetical protein